MPFCVLCLREGVTVSDHHLIPVAMHSKKRIRRRYDKNERNRKVPLCVACHFQIHKMFSEKELADKYSTVEKLKNAPGVGKWVEWIREKPAGFAPKK